MAKLDHVFEKKVELEVMINTIGVKVNEFVEILKRKSSDEILNGSLEEAQNILTQILPIENEYKQLVASQKSFLKVLISNQFSNISEDLEATEEQEIEGILKPEDSPEVEESDVIEESGDTDRVELSNLNMSDMDFTPNDSYRIPILKALIYLGGSAKLEDVAGFIEKDMKNKFKQADHERGANGFAKLWIEMVNTEKDNLLLEGLISQDTVNEKCEIVQNGIEYLSQNAN